MKRIRITLEVDIDLDPFPGTFHTPEDARDQVEKMLVQAVPWYNPAVSIKED